MLKGEYLIKQKLLSEKINLFKGVIKSGFGFGEKTREENPIEYFVACVFYKIHSLGISIENCVFSNDVFLSIYLFRYVYELYIKTLYIFSGSSEEEILLRVHEFFSNKDWKIKDIKEKIDNEYLPPRFKEDHKNRYMLLSRFVHPNYESLKLCLNRTNEQQFEFLEANINLAIWYSIEIMRHFSKMGILNKINEEGLTMIQDLGNTPTEMN